MVIKENLEVIDLIKKNGFAKEEKVEAIPVIRYKKDDEVVDHARGRLHIHGKNVEDLIRSSGIEFEEIFYGEDGQVMSIDRKEIS